MTASHDLKQLQASGFLAPEGGGRSRAYIGTIRLLRRVVELLELPIDTAGDGPIDADLRNATVGALAEKVQAS